MSRKGSSSRRPSEISSHGLHNDLEMQVHQPAEHKRRKSTKEDENQHVDPLIKIEEDKLEQYPENENGLSNSAHRSSSGKALHDSSNTNKTGSLKEVLPTTPKDKPKDCMNTSLDDLPEDLSEPSDDISCTQELTKL